MSNEGHTPTGFLNNYDPIERVVCAAIWMTELERYPSQNSFGVQPFNTDKGIVFCGWRHHSCFLLAGRFVPIDRGNVVEGFLTSHNRFVDRKEGAIVAITAKQLKREVIYLSSEDLY